MKGACRFPMRDYSKPPFHSRGGMQQRVGFLGPAGTFTEQALLSEPTFAEMERVEYGSIPEVLDGVSSEQVAWGIVPIENALEGSVNITLDALIFDHRLRMQREIVIPIVMCLVAPSGMRIDQVQRVVSMPVASAQCRRFLAKHLPTTERVAVNSTALAARMVAEASDGKSAAISTSLAAQISGLDVLAEGIEDFHGNETRFVAVTTGGIPAPTGHDKSSIAVFQAKDRPGSLLSILHEFEVRGLNLTRIESRPTRKALGDYCFIIDLQGHIADETVADALRALRSKNADLLFLGSFPAARGAASAVSGEADDAYGEATEWVAALRAEIGPPE